MKTSLAFLLVAFTSAAFAADPEAPQTRLAQIEKLEVSGTEIGALWKVAKGKWEVTDGVLRGSELARWSSSRYFCAMSESIGHHQTVRPSSSAMR
jgi:hypothetical protein